MAKFLTTRDAEVLFADALAHIAQFRTEFRVNYAHTDGDVPTRMVVGVYPAEGEGQDQLLLPEMFTREAVDEALERYGLPAIEWPADPEKVVVPQPYTGSFILGEHLTEVVQRLNEKVGPVNWSKWDGREYLVHPKVAITYCCNVDGGHYNLLVTTYDTDGNVLNEEQWVGDREAVDDLVQEWDSKNAQAREEHESAIVRTATAEFDIETGYFVVRDEQGEILQAPNEPTRTWSLDELRQQHGLIQTNPGSCYGNRRYRVIPPANLFDSQENEG